jgi:hypothetical protein
VTFLRPSPTFIEVEAFDNGCALLDIKHVVAPFTPSGYQRIVPLDPAVITEQQYWYRRISDGFKVCLTVQRELDGRPWLHASFSFADKMPTYEDMTQVKSLFIGPNHPAYMVLPRAEDHFNYHPFCLHLFAPLAGEDPLPDFLASAGGI